MNDLLVSQYDVVEFKSKHKWAGCLGYVDRLDYLKEDVRVLIGIPVPESGIIYIFSNLSDNEFRIVNGRAKYAFMEVCD